MSVFEIGMLVCFGASWPFALYKTWRSKTSAGKSLRFLVLVFVGYVSGVIHKLLYSRDPVVFLYALNGAMVFGDLLLSLKYRTRRVQPAR